MSNEKMIDWRGHVLDLIVNHRLREAFTALRSMTPGQSWKIINEIDKAEEAYALMLNYAMNGADDPHRQVVYDDIVSSLYGLVDKVVRDANIPVGPSLYYSSVRYENLQLDTIASLLAEYRKVCDNASLFNLAAISRSDKRQRLKEKEHIEQRAFIKIWVSYPLTNDDEEAISEIWNDSVIPSYFKEMVVSALLLGMTEFYDEARIRLLLDAYDCGIEVVSVKAIAALAMSLCMYSDRIPGKKIRDRIAVLRDTTSWSKDVRMVYLQFIRSRDTEKINRKVREELIPRMMELRPEITKINDNASITDLSQLEENPEWQDILEKSGIADKMKELSEMQEDGGDVMMSTFAMLKSFPFFNDLSNWFVPFHSEHSVITESDDHDDAIIELLIASPFLCNGDKYSFYFSLKQVPDAQRRMMLSQINAQNINFAELRNADVLSDDRKRDNIANKYVQDLYRFFKLFRRKGEFRDPFATSLNLWNVAVFQPDINSVDTIRLVSEFYFKHGYYDDALTLFKILVDMIPPENQIFQKMGFSLQQTGDMESALEYYEKAELMNADNIWTIRRLAYCHKILGHSEQALEYFLRLEHADPDDITVSLNIGHCLLELGRHKEAMKYYYKVEFKDEHNVRAYRPLAWCAFMNKEFGVSLRYYEKIMKDGSPTATDYMNMGHLAIASGNYKEAINYYKLSMAESKSDPGQFIQAVKADYPVMSRVGIDLGIVPLVIDAALYSCQIL